MTQQNPETVQPQQVSKFIETEEGLALKPVKIGVNGAETPAPSVEPDEFEEVDLDEWLND